MRRIAELLFHTRTGRLLCLLSVVLLAALIALCARMGEADTVPQQAEEESVQPVTEDAHGAETSVEAPSAPQQDDSQALLEERLSDWLQNHGFPRDHEVEVVSDETVDVGTGALARIVYYRVAGTDLYIAAQEQEGGWSVWTLSGADVLTAPESFTDPSRRVIDGMISIWQTEVLEDLLPAEVVALFPESWSSFCAENKVSGNAGLIAAGSIVSGKDSASFVLVVHDFEQDVPSTRYFLAEYGVAAASAPAQDPSAAPSAQNDDGKQAAEAAQAPETQSATAPTGKAEETAAPVNPTPTLGFKEIDEKTAQAAMAGGETG